MPKQLFRICPSDKFCRVQNLPTSSVELIWPITELYFRLILSTDFMNRFYQDVKTGPKRCDFTYKSHLMRYLQCHQQRKPQFRFIRHSDLRLRSIQCFDFTLQKQHSQSKNFSIWTVTASEMVLQGAYISPCPIGGCMLRFG